MQMKQKGWLWRALAPLALVAGVVMATMQPAADASSPTVSLSSVAVHAASLVRPPRIDTPINAAAVADGVTWEQAKAAAAVRPKPSSSPREHRAAVSRHGTGACGPGGYVDPQGVAHDLPPCWVMNRESGGDLNAYNPTGCNRRGCSGKWQCDPNTCSGHGDEQAQDAEAAAIWDGGDGCSHWAACG
jgi:hypothetical protein